MRKVTLPLLSNCLLLLCVYFFPAKVLKIIMSTHYSISLSSAPELFGKLFLKKFIDFRKRERDIDLLFYLFMHLFVVSFMYSDWGLNLQPWHIGMIL